MPKYYRGSSRKFYRGSRDKYSVEQQAGTLNIPEGQQAWAVVVPDSSLQGMRKVKHLTISLGSSDNPSSYAGSHAAWWALVYVPQGTTPNTLNITGTTGMYEPNQFVMNCGVADFSGGPLRISSPTSRNLNSGDRIVLIMANATASAASIFYSVRYAVTLQ